MANMKVAASQLQKVILESPEFIQLKARYEDVMADVQAKELFAQFRNLQAELSQKMMQGVDMTPEESMKTQQVLAMLEQNEKINKLKEAEAHVNSMINDLNKIIMEPLETLYKSQ